MANGKFKEHPNLYCLKQSKNNLKFYFKKISNFIITYFINDHYLVFITIHFKNDHHLFFMRLFKETTYILKTTIICVLCIYLKKLLTHRNQNKRTMVNILNINTIFLITQLWQRGFRPFQKPVIKKDCVYINVFLANCSWILITTGLHFRLFLINF